MKDPQTDTLSRSPCRSPTGKVGPLVKAFSPQTKAQETEDGSQVVRVWLFGQFNHLVHMECKEQHNLLGPLEFYTIFLKFLGF